MEPGFIKKPGSGREQEDMASFDIIDASGRSYRLVWQERHYLAQLAAVPMLVKLVTYMAIIALSWEKNFARQALLFLPSYLADGWMLAHFTRLVLLDQRWPFRPSGNAGIDMNVLQDRTRGILGGMVTHTLIKFLMAGAIGVVVATGFAIETAHQPPSLLTAALMMGFLAATLWSFRLMWLYIPVSVGYPVRRFLRDVHGYMASLYMIGVWLVCFLPVFLLVRFLISAIIAPYGGTIETLPLPTNVIVGFLIVLMDTVNELLATAGIAFGMRAMLSARDRGQA